MATVGRKEMLETVSPRIDCYRCLRSGCRELYCSDDCRSRHSDTGHDFLCTGHPTTAESASDNCEKTNVRVAKDFVKYALESNELFLVAAKLITSWIALSSKLACDFGATSASTAEARFEAEMTSHVERFIAYFPPAPRILHRASEVGGRKRGRGAFELEDKAADETTTVSGRALDSSTTMTGVMLEQAEESWMLFRALVVYGRRGGEVASILSGIQSSLNFGHNGAEREPLFSERLWLLVLSSLQHNLIPITVTSPIAAMIKDIIHTASTEERYRKAEPLLNIFYEKSPAVHKSSSTIERKIARLAQFGQAGGVDENLFSPYNSHHLVLLPILCQREDWNDVGGPVHRAIPHSCLPNTHMDISVLSPGQSSDDSCAKSPGISPPLLSRLLISLAAVRDIGAGGCFTIADDFATVSRLQLHSTGDSTTDNSLSDKDSVAGHSWRQQLLRLVYSSSESYTCRCILCTFESERFAGSVDGADLLYINETLEQLEVAQNNISSNPATPQNDDILMPPVLPPPSKVVSKISESVLFAIGEYYMQNNKYSDAAQVYFCIIKERHQNYHRSTDISPKFDATPYFHLGSALLDAGKSQTAFNAWSLGYGLDPKNLLLRTQRQKDLSFLYVGVSEDKGTDNCISFESFVAKEMIRNFYLFSTTNDQPFKDFNYNLENLYRTCKVNTDVSASLVRHGLGIYSTNARALNEVDAVSIIRQAERYANEEIDFTTDDGHVIRRRRGWTTTRHYDAPTTDIPVHEIPGVLEIFNKCVLKQLAPMLYGLLGDTQKKRNTAYFYINDAFIVKYEVPHDNSAQVSQRFLPIHTDQSHYSFTIALNAKHEYENGGTYFVDLDQSLQVDEGHCLMFPGTLRHGGDPISKGTRYILAVFVFLSDDPTCHTGQQTASVVGANRLPPVTYSVGQKETSADNSMQGGSSQSQEFSFGFSNF